MDPRPDPRPTTWARRWETALGDDEHRQLAALLAGAFPPDAALLTGTRTWVGARPELRVVGRHGATAVAHTGVVRRFLRIADTGGSVLVGDVGLVAVASGFRGAGLGAELMGAVAATLAALDLPFGFLTCGAHARPFYERCGWTGLDQQVLHSIGIRHDLETTRHNGMVLPVRSPLSEWPTAGTLERNGQEI